jgi:ABC-type uncharacterized transport system permease subunit
MKRNFQFGAAIFIVVVALTMCIAVIQSEAVEYLGHFCWKMDYQNDSKILKLGITHVGDAHLLLNGKGGNEAIHGSAEIDGDKIYMTTSSSGNNDQYTWTFTGRGVLDVATLNGTLEIMGVSHSRTSPDPEEAHMDYDGPFILTYTQCP